MYPKEKIKRMLAHIAIFLLLVHFAFFSTDSVVCRLSLKEKQFPINRCTSLTYPIVE